MSEAVNLKCLTCKCEYSWWFEFFNTGRTMICLEESFCQSINMLAIQQYFPVFRLPQTGSERSKVIKQEEVKKKVKEVGRLLKLKSGLSYWCNSRNCAKPKGLG